MLESQSCQDLSVPKAEGNSGQNRRFKRGKEVSISMNPGLCLEDCLTDSFVLSEVSEEFSPLSTSASSQANLAPVQDLPALADGHPQLEQWNSQRFRFLKVLMIAPRSGGQIELHMDRMTSATVVVKRLPMSRMREDAEAYHFLFPDEQEDPWKEIEVSQLLGRPGDHFMGSCLCYGAFRNQEGDVLLVSEYLPGGDLFDMASLMSPPGPLREAEVWPIVMCLLEVVLALHSRGIAHSDISLENALLRRLESKAAQVVLVDFGAVVTSNLGVATGVRGKPSYQAPEMHTHPTYDARAADIFACGVVAYALVVGSYPWSSTRPGACLAFEYAQRQGVQALLQRRRVPAQGLEKLRMTVASCLSLRFQRLLVGLLDADPKRRLHYASLRSFEAIPEVPVSVFPQAAPEVPVFTNPSVFPQALWGG